MRRTLFITLLCLAWSARAEVDVAFVERVTVDGPVIRIGDIALLDGGTAAEREQIASTEVGRAAPPGRHRDLTGRSLRELTAKRLPSVRVAAPERVRVETAAREIDPAYVKARLEQAIDFRMPWPRDAVVLDRWALPPEFPVAPGATQLRIYFRPGEDFLGRVAAELEFTDPDRPGSDRTRRSASVEVSVRAPVVVARKDVRRGHTLSSNALALEVRDLRSVPRDVALDLAEVVDRRTTRSISAGQTVTRGALVSEPVVKRGQSILVEAGGEGLEVRVEARALERGALGDLIKLENPATRRRFNAEVTGPGTARLPGSGARLRP